MESIIKWQTGEPKYPGMYLVQTKGGMFDISEWGMYDSCWGEQHGSWSRFNRFYIVAWCPLSDIKPYKAKEKTMEKKEHLILDCVSTDKGHELVPHEGYEIKQEGDKYYLVEKQPQYPKTYKECCDVLGMQSNLFLSLSSQDIDGEVEEKSYGYKIAFQMNCLYELLVCRDAYWKKAGDWEPSDVQIVYGISRSCDKLERLITCLEVRWY